MVLMVIALCLYYNLNIMSATKFKYATPKKSEIKQLAKKMAPAMKSLANK